MRRFIVALGLLFHGGIALVACSDNGRPAASSSPDDAAVANPGTDGSAEPADASHPDGDAEAGVYLGVPPPANRCRSSSDCTATTCVAEPRNCSAGTSTCLVDGDCAASGANYICDRPSPGCDIACIPGCSLASDCGTAQSCNAGRCEAISCTTDLQCGSPNFACLARLSGNACGRKACTTDSECNGHCVFENGGSVGDCREDWGYCAVAP